MGGPYLRTRKTHTRFTAPRTEYSSDVIKNYFKAVRYASDYHANPRHEFQARARMRIAQVAAAAAAASEAESQSNMTFSQGVVSSMTAGSASIGGTIYTGTVASNRQAVRARRILRGTRASSTRPTAMKAAMYLPGRGAEVDLIANNYLQPISHVIPWKHAKLRYDGVTSCLENPKGNRLSMDFALKMIIECQKAGMTGPSDPINNPQQIIPTRFHCAHIFRHTNQNTSSSKVGNTATDTIAWHNTLGPDASYVRLTPAQGGSMQTATIPAGITNTLLSPYRQPSAGSNMYSRISLQTLENLGWNMNPLKFTGNLESTFSTAAGEGFAGVTVFANSTKGDPSNAIATSNPHNQMIAGVNLPHVSNNKFMTQHGPGGVRYTFSNDGSNAVTLECVIVAFKENANAPTADEGGISDPYATFVHTAQAAFTNRLQMKQGAQRLAGDPHTVVPTTASNSAGAIFTNAETEFIPSNIWPYMGRNAAGTAGTTVTVNPFKLISRDQFIIGGGQSRLWKCSFPSEVYDASQDSPQFATNVNSHTIMVIWGLCSAPTPAIETSSDATVGKIMLSREPQNCNVSVVGTYHETPTPVFCKINPAPINVVGSLTQVSVNAHANWPAGSKPAGIVGNVNPNGVAANSITYVDLPRSGQQPFVEGATTPASTITVGTMSTSG